MTTVSLGYAILALVTASVPTPDAGAQADQTMKSTPVTITATIEAIDQTNRIVTLKGPKGNLVDTYVSESNKRFNELKVGDQVKAQYQESLAMSIRKPGSAAPTAGASESVTPREGAPGATATRQLTGSVTVTALDSGGALDLGERTEGQRVLDAGSGPQAARGCQGRRHDRHNLHAGPVDRR